MNDPQFFIAGDVEIPEDVTDVRLVTPLSRYDFVTIEIGPDDTLDVRVIPVADLQSFDGALFQADSGDDGNSVVLRQVDLQFWPFEDDESSEDQADEEEEDKDEGDIPRQFKVVGVEWWKDFMSRHRRG